VSRNAAIARDLRDIADRWELGREITFDISHVCRDAADALSGDGLKTLYVTKCLACGSSGWDDRQPPSLNSACCANNGGPHTLTTFTRQVLDEAGSSPRSSPSKAAADLDDSIPSKDGAE
jgi:hypothetical protein